MGVIRVSFDTMFIAFFGGFFLDDITAAAKEAIVPAPPPLALLGLGVSVVWGLHDADAPDRQHDVLCELMVA